MDATGVNAKEKNICLWERGAGGLHYSPSLPLKSRPRRPLEMRESALHQSKKEAPCLAKLWESIPRITGNRSLGHALKPVEEAVLADQPRRGVGPGSALPLQPPPVGERLSRQDFTRGSTELDSWLSYMEVTGSQSFLRGKFLTQNNVSKEI